MPGFSAEGDSAPVELLMVVSFVSTTNCSTPSFLLMEKFSLLQAEGPKRRAISTMSTFKRNSTTKPPAIERWKKRSKR